MREEREVVEMLRRLLARSCRIATVLCSAALAVGLGSGSGSLALAASEVRVTAVEGDATADGEALRMHGEVQAGEELEVGDDGRCSVLLAEAAVLQFCNRARLRVGEGGDANRVRLDSGELKATVGPRPAGQPLEIHTPAAIAIILGTVIHVKVDADTGDTVVSSLESKIRIQSSNSLVPGFVVIDAGEQVTIRRGEAPQNKRKFDVGSFSQSGSCTFDEGFHYAASRAQRATQSRTLMEEIAYQDVPPDLLPPVAAGPTERTLPPPNPLDELPVEACLPGLCTELGAGGVPPPEPCVGTPGDHCAF
jgi:hypothetical protein